MSREKIGKVVFLVTVNIVLNVIMAIPWTRVADSLFGTKTSGSRG